MYNLAHVFHASNKRKFHKDSIYYFCFHNANSRCRRYEVLISFIVCEREPLAPHAACLPLISHRLVTNLTVDVTANSLIHSCLNII